ncbi:MAG: LamG domain-containing protein, partial [Planctomycetota bacterium]
MFQKLVYLITFVVVLANLTSGGLGLTWGTANASATFQEIGALLVTNAGPSLPCSSVEDFDTGDFSKFPWEHGGSESWTVTSREKHSGTYSAQAGSIEHDGSTTLQVTLDCVSGNISFYRKVSSEPRCDYLKFYIDGVIKDRWSGEEDWAKVSLPVPAGPRTFEWTYSKDDSVSAGGDTAWIDDIVFPVDCNDGPAVYDPSLVGWWKLDDERTGTVIDYSGNNRNGTLHGDPQWVSGFHGGALEFNGDDCVTIDGYKGVVGNGTNTPAWSVAAWVKTSGDGEVVGWGSTGGGNRMEFRISSGRTRAEGGNGNTQGDTTMNDGQWHHIAMTVAPNSTYNSGVNLYLDGKLDTRANTDPDPFHPVANFDVIFGQRYSQSNERWFTGLIDDVRIYDRELTEAEIAVLGAPPTAHDPSPADGAVHSQMWVSLSWLPGSDAVSHNVYFGENFDDVAAGAPDTFGGNQTETFFVVGLTGFPYPDGFTMGKTYYWRVDEIEANGTIRKGEVWSFKVRENLLVDDFDSYADTGDLLLRWIDGTTNSTGSTISLESEFAGNAMKLIYDNSSAPWYSQAGRISSAPEDWTVGGAKALGLWLRGDVDNSAEQIYVALEDASGRSAAVLYSDRNDLLQNRWEVWDIALQDFVDANGVDLADIKKFAIGIGDGVSAGGSGVVYIDDIRLYPPRCLPEYIATDFTGDCVTDYEDLDVILRSWLVS